MFARIAAPSACALAAVGFAASPTAGAVNVESSSRGAVIEKGISNAPDQEAYFSHLSPADQKAYVDFTRPVSVKLSETPAVPASETKPFAQTRSNEYKNVSQAQSLTAGSGCWTKWQRFEANATAGNTVFGWWQGLKWCSSGGRVTSYNVFDRGGESSTPGWSFTGHGGAGSYNVGWETRQYTQEKFTFGIGSYGYTDTRCAQIRGGATGLYSVRASCTLG